MLLNSIPQIYELTVTTKYDSLEDIPRELYFNDNTYIIFKTSINFIDNTITYFLFFTDIMSQTNFINILPKHKYAYTLLGLTYFNTTPFHLRDFING